MIEKDRTTWFKNLRHQIAARWDIGRNPGKRISDINDGLEGLFQDTTAMPLTTSISNDGVSEATVLAALKNYYEIKPELVKDLEFVPANQMGGGELNLDAVVEGKWFQEYAMDRRYPEGMAGKVARASMKEKRPYVTIAHGLAAGKDNTKKLALYVPIVDPKSSAWKDHTTKEMSYQLIDQGILGEEDIVEMKFISKPNIRLLTEMGYPKDFRDLCPKHNIYLANIAGKGVAIVIDTIPRLNPAADEAPVVVSGIYMSGKDPKSIYAEEPTQPPAPQTGQVSPPASASDENSTEQNA